MCSLKPSTEFADKFWNLVVNYWDVLLLDSGKAAVFNIWLQTTELFLRPDLPLFISYHQSHISNLSIL